MVDPRKQSIKIIGLLLSLWFVSIDATAQSNFSLLPTQQQSSLLQKSLLDKPSLLNIEKEKTGSVMFKTDFSKIHHDGLGFFCKMEDKASAKSNMQLRMRLGSLQYVDALEQKLPAYQLNSLDK